MTTTTATLAASTIAVVLAYDCEICQRPLEPVDFSDGGRWSIRGLASHGRRKFKSTLCFDHYVDACRQARGGRAPNRRSDKYIIGSGLAGAGGAKRRQHGANDG